jgi:hypothetical protein
MFRSSTIIRELVLSLAKVMLEFLCLYRLCGGAFVGEWLVLDFRMHGATIKINNNLLNGATDHCYSLKSQSSAGNFISCLGNHYILFRRFREIAKSDYWVCHICPSVRLSLYPTAWNNSTSKRMIFHESLYLSVFGKSVEKIRGSLKSDKNNGYLTRRRLYTYDNILMNSL